MKRITALVFISLLLVPQAWAETAAGTLAERSSDTWLEASIATTFLLNSHLNAFEIDTDVNAGVVTLDGTVDESIDKDLAEEIARSFEGVKSVENKIKIAGRPGDAERKQVVASKRSFSQMVNDATTTAAVKSRLLWNKHTEGSNINVDTSNNIVTLKGTVRSGDERELAERLAENTSGVRRVENQLSVNTDQSAKLGAIDLDRVSDNAGSAIRKVEDEASRSVDEEKVEKSARGALKEVSKDVSDTWLTTKIKSTLLFTGETSGADVDVKTTAGMVTLTGSARSQSQKERISEIVNDIVGVKAVDNRLQLKSAAVS